MEGLKRFIGVVLIVIAAIVAIQTIFEPLYHTSTPDSPHSSAWNYINPLSAISIILGLVFGYIRMSGVGADSSVQEFIASEYAILRVHFHSHNLSSGTGSVSWRSPQDLRLSAWTPEV